MKKTVYCVVIALLACISVNAQNVGNVICEEMAMATETQIDEAMAGEPVVCQDIEAELARPTVLNHSMVADITGDYQNDPEWEHAKAVRNTGIILTSVGSAVAIGMGISAIANAKKEDFGGVFTGLLSTGVALCGAGAAIAGAITWAVGNSKMKSIRLASEGTGLAYTF